MEKSVFKRIMELSSKNNAYLKTLQKALVFDEDDLESFQNTYHEMIDELVRDNWSIYEIAKKSSVK